MLRTLASALAITTLTFAPRSALAQSTAPPATPAAPAAPAAPAGPVAPVLEPQYTLAGVNLVVSLPGASREVPLGCQGQTLLRHRTQLHVACDDGRVLTFDLTDPATPTLVRRENAGGSVQGFFVLQDRVWVQIARTEAHPLGMGNAPDLLPTSGATTASPTGTAGTEDAALSELWPERRVAPRVRNGRVREVRSGEVLVDLGTDDGIALDSHVLLYVLDRVPFGNQGGAVMHQRKVAVGRVIGVAPGTAHVRLGMNEIVPATALARVTDEPVSASAVAPPRARGYWDLDITARPFTPLGTLGLGLLFDASVGYRFTLPLYLEVGITPAGFILAGNSSPFGGSTEAVSGVFASRVAVHYDAQMLSVGVGIGGSTMRPSSSGIPVTLVGGVMFTQSLRVGARDGLHLAAENSVAIVQGRFEFIGIRGQVQIPLGPELWMVLRGGGGASGYGFGEVGVRLPVHGHGERGSVFLTPTIGGAGITRGFSMMAGPMLGLQLEARL